MAIDDDIDIFISYSVKDSRIVHNYVQFLENAGFKVWYDRKGLYSGVKYTHEIVEAIKRSRILVFFSSVNSNNSDWVLGEILTAKHYAKTILPVRIDNSDYSDKVMLIMIPLQYVDCINKPIDIGSNEIYDSIVRHIGHPVDYKGKTYDDVDSDENDKLYSKEKRGYTFLSVISSLFFSIFMLWISGEHHINRSLSYFTLLCSTLISIMCSMYSIYHIKGWAKRKHMVNLALLLGIHLFMTYSTTALGLCFSDMSIFLLNAPSLVCSLISVVGILLLVSFRKLGYYILFVCALFFTLGAHMWTGYIEATYFIGLASALCLYILTYLLVRYKKDGLSTWEQLK